MYGGDSSGFDLLLSIKEDKGIRENNYNLR